MKTQLRVFLPLLACAIVALAGCAQLKPSEAEKPATSAHEDLVMGYTLLQDTLSDESHLRALKLFKEITFSAPAEEVGTTMDVLSKASTQRMNELDKLRELAPDVTGEPATSSPIGDAITALAKEAGTHEMLDGRGTFDPRFMLLQAQATRMVSAIALAIAEHEPNVERKKWLNEVSIEYEGHRERIVDVILKYFEGKGAEQGG